MPSTLGFCPQEVLGEYVEVCPVFLGNCPVMGFTVSFPSHFWCICHCRSSSISAPCPHPPWITMLSLISHVRLCVTPWTIVCKAPLSMGFSRQEYWSGLPCPPPGDLPDTGIEPGSPALKADYLPCEPSGKLFRQQMWESNPGRFSPDHI